MSTASQIVEAATALPLEAKRKMLTRLPVEVQQQGGPR